MAEPQLKSRSFVEKVVPAHWPKAGSDAEEGREQFQEARARTRPVPMLDIRLADGTIESFPYAYLTRVRYKPGDTLVLQFGADEVRAEGRNLEAIRAAVSEHRMPFLQQGTEEEERLKPEEAAHIGRIVIKERDEL